MIVWYLSVTLLGLLAYPLLRLALPGLADRGYPLARVAGMLIFSYLAWLGGSLSIPVTRLMLSLLLLGMAVFAAALAYRQREALRQEWAERRGYFLLVEGLALGLFIAFLLVRLANPDLWHPYHGGEKPMDFSYFNAVLKSTTFPPYDPWYAGGYLNYYYYGFVFVGMLVKWLGIVPSFAYNLILPTLFSMVAMGAFSIAFNLRAAAQDPDSPFRRGSAAICAGLAGSALMTLLGNLGGMRMILRGYVILGSPGLETGSLSGAGKSSQPFPRPGRGAPARRVAALLPRRLVLDSQPGDFRGRRDGADHRVPPLYLPLRRSARPHDRPAHRPAGADLGALGGAGQGALAQPLCRDALLPAGRIGHRRAVSRQPFGYLHLPAHRPGRAGLRCLALRQLAAPAAAFPSLLCAEGPRLWRHCRAADGAVDGAGAGSV